jgi:hypothetical protein
VTQQRNIFISYSSQDKLTVDAIVEALENASLKCWIAPRDITPGRKYAEAILDALDECKVFLVVLTESSNASPQVEMEVDRAASRNKTIVSYKLYQGKLSKSFEYYLGKRHRLQAMNPPTERDNQALIAALRKSLPPERPEPAAAAAVKEKHVAAPTAPMAKKKPSQPEVSPSRPALKPLAAVSLVLGLTVVVGLVAWSTGALQIQPPQIAATITAVPTSGIPTTAVPTQATATERVATRPPSTVMPTTTEARPSPTGALWYMSTPLTPGEKITTGNAFYGFYGWKGEIVTLIVESSNADPGRAVCSRPGSTYITTLKLIPDAGGVSVASVRETQSRDAIRDYELPATGAYHLQVTCAGSACQSYCTDAVLTLEKK